MKVHKLQFDSLPGRVPLKAGKILSCGNQNGKLSIWFLEHESFYFDVLIVETNVAIGNDWEFLGTVQFQNGMYILHVFTKPSK